MSSSKLIHIASIAALAFGVSQVALAASELSRGDRKFVEEAAQGGMAEVELGKLAEQHATSDQVKQFGRKMATDHQKANEQLKKIAAAKAASDPEIKNFASSTLPTLQQHLDKIGRASCRERV